MRRTILVCSFTFTLLLAACSNASKLEETRAKPNVLVIMTDQHNAGVLGCAGDPVVKTPAIDSLAASGVRFTNAFCNTPQCAPSRYSIWTGLYARSHGLRANRVPEDTSHQSIADILGDEGWTTATIGKHHMSSSPKKHGFQYVIDSTDFDEYRAKNNIPDWNEHGSWFRFVNKAMHGHVGSSSVSNEEHRDGYFANEAIKYLRSDRDEPFCLWLSFYGPHTPIAPSAPWSDMYEPTDMRMPATLSQKGLPGYRNMEDAQQLFAEFTAQRHRRVAALYYGFVSQLDHNIGLVLAELEALGLSENTIVVFTSDHGEMRGSHGLWGKEVFHYDAISRVPLIIRVPWLAPQTENTTNESLVELVDLLPTLLDLTGTPIPSALQGRSLRPQLEGDSPPWRDYVIAEIGYPNRHYGRSYMARSKQGKYVWSENEGDPMEIYFDLLADPNESNNRILNPQYAGQIQTHRSALDSWKQRTPEAAMIPPGPIGD